MINGDSICLQFETGLNTISNLEWRTNAMEKIDAKRKSQLESVIEKFIIEDNSADIKTVLKALRFIDDETIMYRIVKASSKTLIESDVVKRITSQEVLEKIAFDTELDVLVRITAIKKISSQDVLKRLYECGSDSIRKIVVSLIIDESFLYDTVFNEEVQHVSVVAVNHISTQEKLYNIAVRHTVLDVQIAAVGQLKEQKWLAKVAKLAVLNPSVRIEAIKKLDSNTSETLLYNIAKNDSDFLCRIAAIKRLTMPKMLIDIACEDLNEDVQYVALSSLPEIFIFSELNKKLMAIIEGDFSYKVKAMAVEKIAVSSDEFFVELIKKEKNEEVRIAAVQRIDNHTHLANIAYYEVNKYQYQSNVRMEALKRLKTIEVINLIALSDRSIKVREYALQKAYPATLVSVAINDHEAEVSIAAVKKIENDYDLIEVLLHTKNRWVRNAAVSKLCAIT